MHLRGSSGRGGRWAAIGLLLVALAAGAPSRAAAGGNVKANDTGLSYLYGIAHTGFNPSETMITPSSVAGMQSRVFASAPAEISSQPVVANGVVYWGSWDGYEHATRVSDGTLLWQTYLGDETKADCWPQHLGVASTSAIVRETIGGQLTTVLLVGGGGGTFYALNATTGATVWQRSFGSPQNGYFLWGSPAIYNGAIYMGIASIGDCPLVQGQLVKLSATDGSLLATFNVVPTGCTGGGIWSSPTIDVSESMVYISTGTTGSCATPEQYAQAVVQLHASTLSVVGSWKHNQGSWAPPPSQQITDGDFGATPTLFTATINGVQHRMVGLIAKNGIYYAFDRDHLGAGPVWETPRLGTNGDDFATSAWDGSHLYVAAHYSTVNGTLCTDSNGNGYDAGSLGALNPATGTFIWQTCLTGGQPDAAVTAVPGLVLVSFGPVFYTVDAVSGQVRYTFQEGGYNLRPPLYNFFLSPPFVANGTAYAGNADGNLVAFAPPSS